MKPRKIILCVDRLDAKDGMVWAVRTGGKWFSARTVHVLTDMETVFRGRDAMQPKAYLEGFGVVRTDGRGTITIAAA
jgi:hypothetical protein